MNIGQMFAKSINREIKPVVKPGQVDDATVKLELQEYIVHGQEKICASTH